MEFGTKIKNLRNKRGITQEALAKAMGVTPHGPVIIGLN